MATIDLTRTKGRMTNRHQGTISHKHVSITTSGPILPTKTVVIKPIISHMSSKQGEGHPAVIITHHLNRSNVVPHNKNTMASKIEDFNRGPHLLWNNRVPAKGTRITTHHKRSVVVTTTISMDLLDTHNRHTTIATVNPMNRLKE